MPSSDSFHGCAKATFEHMGFLFACGRVGSRGDGGQVRGPAETSSKMVAVKMWMGDVGAVFQTM